MRFCQKGSERDKRLIDRGVSLVVGDESSLNTSKVFETDYYFHLTHLWWFDLYVHLT